MGEAELEGVPVQFAGEDVDVGFASEGIGIDRGRPPRTDREGVESGRVAPAPRRTIACAGVGVCRYDSANEGS